MTVAFPQDRTCPYQPPAGYQPLADERPLARITLYDGRRAWAVTGHATARRLLVDPRLSSDRTNPAWPLISARVAANAGDVQKKIIGIITALAGVDGPVHSARRRLLIPSFTIRRVNAMRPKIQEIVDRQLDSVIEDGAPADLVRAFASPVPYTVLCDLLGLPADDHDFFEQQSHRLLFTPQANEAYDELMAYLGTLVETKRENPGEGILDDLVAEHGATDTGELLRMTLAVLLAGHDTTTSMISLGAFALLQDPERLAELRADPALVPAATDELMRLLSIADGLTRVATEDIEVGASTIRAGDGVFFMTSLINRDEDVYERPDSLDWHRVSARDHISFGFGAHQCLGQNVARVMLEIALHTLLQRLPGLRLAVGAEEIRFKPGAAIQGLFELPVTW
nr:cytochrome P450 [uncultured bacterium]